MVGSPEMPPNQFQIPLSLENCYEKGISVFSSLAIQILGYYTWSQTHLHMRSLAQGQQALCTNCTTDLLVLKLQMNTHTVPYFLGRLISYEDFEQLL